MVDSYGGIYPEDVRETIALVRSKTSVKLGFHGHNNLEMALANTLVAIEEGVDIVDATITGMGRGAGNLKTELLLTSLQAKGKVDFDYNELSKVVDTFTQLQKENEWGTNLPYMVSGANSLPQKQVMEWVGKRFYSFNSIIRALNNQSQGIKDNISFPQLNIKNNKYTGAVLVGGGDSPVEHADAIETFLFKNPDILVVHASSRNALCLSNIPNDQFFCLVGNEGYRMEKVFENKEVIGKCVLPPFPRVMGTYVPNMVSDRTFELSEINFTSRYQDSCTAIALQTIIDCDIEKVYITGYDGYSGIIQKKDQELFLENEYLFEKATNLLELVSITLSNYSFTQKNSVYSLING